MTGNLNDLSVVLWYNEVNPHKCGYCKNPKGSLSNGLWADSLTVEEYQILIDRGWRRAGKYCYKPIMEETCCPQYTIKCEVKNINLTKSQKKVIKKFNKYLKDGIYNKDMSSDEHMEAQEIALDLIQYPSHFLFDKNEVEVSKKSSGKEQLLPGTGEPCHTRINKETKNVPLSNDMSGINSDQVKLKASYKEGVGIDHSKVPCKKAKLMRLERKKEKLKKLGLELEKIDSAQNQKSIEQFLDEIADNAKIKFKQCLIPTSRPNSDWESVMRNEFELYKKYQTIVHDDPAEKLSMSGFYRFLVDSPLEPKGFPNDNGPGFGSFHQQYWFDDKLVAVGVIDILPKCISSVYFFYDPDYRGLSLGTYGSLREIQFVRSLQNKFQGLENYYMGFYIHSCPKMRYKGKLVPSYLLCPETYCWMPIDNCIKLLEENNYCRLNTDLDVFDEDIPTSRDLATVKIVYTHTLMSFKTFKDIYTEDASELFTKIGTLVGKKCISSLVFWFS